MDRRELDKPARVPGALEPGAVGRGAPATLLSERQRTGRPRVRPEPVSGHQAPASIPSCSPTTFLRRPCLREDSAHTSTHLRVNTAHPRVTRIPTLEGVMHFVREARHSGAAAPWWRRWVAVLPGELHPVWLLLDAQGSAVRASAGA